MDQKLQSIVPIAETGPERGPIVTELHEVIDKLDPTTLGYYIRRTRLQDFVTKIPDDVTLRKTYYPNMTPTQSVDARSFIKWIVEKRADTILADDIYRVVEAMEGYEIDPYRQHSLILFEDRALGPHKQRALLLFNNQLDFQAEQDFLQGIDIDKKEGVRILIYV